MVESERIQALNDKEPKAGKYVLYWMQQSQRAHFNPALEHSIREANQRNLPVLVAFGLMDDYPEANARHYAFMLQGLQEVARDLHKGRRNINSSELIATVPRHSHTFYRGG